MKLKLANNMILNKLSVKLINNDKLLLINRLNFAPTLNWSEATKNLESKNLHEHIRIKWALVLEIKTA